jgi:hypothetical protein
MNEGITYDVKSKEDCVIAIIEEYKRFDSCIGDLLYSIGIVGFSVQDVVDIFATVMHKIEDDLLIQIVDNEPVVRGFKE